MDAYQGSDFFCEVIGKHFFREYRQTIELRYHTGSASKEKVNEHEQLSASRVDRLLVILSVSGVVGQRNRIGSGAACGCSG